MDRGLLVMTLDRPEIAQANPGSIVRLPAPPVSDYWVSITRQESGLLVFDGYVPDQETRDAFAEAGNTDVNFLKLGSGAPPTYRAGVAFGLELLRHLSQGRVLLSQNDLSISGIAETPASYSAIRALLDENLPAGLSLAATELETPEPIPSVEPDSVITPAEPEGPGESEALPEAPRPAQPPQAAPPAPSALAQCRERVAELSAHNAILFQSGNAVIADSANAELDRFAEALALCPEARIYVEGHTDSDGDAQRNLALSVARAEAVVNALIERGTDPARLYAIGYGESQPIADNATAEGKRQNRRIVVTVHEADEQGR